MQRLLPCLTLAALLAVGFSAPASAQAQTQYIGEIALVPYTFCPAGWAEANGQLLPIAQNDALFALYGTTYGGDGRTTFALPDLRGRVPLDQGAVGGQPSYKQGEKGGTETFTLTVSQMPGHTHAAQATSAMTNNSSPNNALIGTFAANAKVYASPGGTALQFNPAAIASTGNNLPVNNMQPYLTMRFCVALFGIFPSRN